MKTSRSFAVIGLVGFLALSGTRVSFGQAPVSADEPVQVPEPVPAAATQPVPAAPIQPLPTAPIQPLPAAPAQPIPAAPAQPLPAAPVQPVPGPGDPSLSLSRGSHIIGSRALLAGGVSIGTVQDMLFVAGSGEYVLVANPSGFVTIPRSLTIFEPVPRILQVNMTFAQVSELPRLLQISQLNRHFLERVHTFFRSPRGEAILRNNIVRNTKPTHAPSVAERQVKTRPPGAAERRAETRTTNKPPIRP